METAGVSIKPMITTLLDSIHKHLSDHRRGEVIREGVQVKITMLLFVFVRVVGLQF